MGVNRFYQSLRTILENVDADTPQTTRPVYLRHTSHARALSVYEVLCMDVNNLIYGIARKSEDNQRFLQHMDTLVCRILKNYKVSRSVYMALDGPGPRAKLILQRARRYARAERDRRKRMQEEEEEGEEDDVEGDVDDMIHELGEKSEVGGGGGVVVEESEGNAKCSPKGIDVNQFTPGTQLMDEIKERLCQVGDRVLREESDYANTTFSISGADHAGEGEYKCLWHCFEYFHAEKRRAPHRRPRALVIGADSDLVLFALQASHLGDVDVLKLESASRGTLFHARAIRAALLSQFPLVTDARGQQCIIDDFCFLALLSGNDFVPKLRGYNFMAAWDAYIKLKGTADHADDFIVGDLGPFSTNVIDTHCEVNTRFLRMVLSHSASKLEYDLLLMHPKTYLNTIISMHSSITKEESEGSNPPEGIAQFNCLLLGNGMWQCELSICNRGAEMCEEGQSPGVPISTAIGHSKRFAEILAVDNAFTVNQDTLRDALSIECDTTWKEIVEEYLAVRDSMLETLLGTKEMFTRTADLNIRHDKVDMPDSTIIDHMIYIYISSLCTYL